jgi:hypothetical protein
MPRCDVDTTRIGVCEGCGALCATGMTTNANGSCYPWVVTATNGVSYNRRLCLDCNADVGYPVDQDLLIAAFQLGGFDAVLPDMISEPALRARYRGHLTASDAVRAAVHGMAPPKRRR